MKPKDETPSAAEHAKLRQYLAAKGMDAPTIDKMVGAAPNKSRKEIAGNLTVWLHGRPKG